MLPLADVLAPGELEVLEAGDMLAGAEAASPVWKPQHREDCPGGDGCTCPQPAAYVSRADVIGYGGAAGGGKSDLALGLAGTKHRRSAIFRRVFPSLRGIIERSREIFNRAGQSHADDSFNESSHVWRLTDGRMIELGAVQFHKDLKKWQGQPHDFLTFDEATEFPEAFVRFMMAWLRTTIIGLACQMLLTFNPPMDDSGAWVVRFFAPWLDPTHPRPAGDGELRWYAMVDGKEVERPDGTPFEHKEKSGKVVIINPKSRTFFHASLKDNPALLATDYGDTIDALPEPLRSLLKGNFDGAKIVDPWQVIPPAWVRAAQARWEAWPVNDEGEPLTVEGGELVLDEDEQPIALPLTAVGADPARGGEDDMAIAPLRGRWFAPIETYPGSAVPDGPTAAALLVVYLVTGIPVGIDVIGIGSSVIDSANMTEGANAVAINNSEGVPDLRDKSGRIKFLNVRAASYWGLREALDPDNGLGLALPPDTELLSELCAPHFKLTSRGIQIEPKEQITDRLGHSPNRADAAVMAWWVGAVPTGSDLIAW